MNPCDFYEHVWTDKVKTNAMIMTNRFMGRVADVSVVRTKLNQTEIVYSKNYDIRRLKHVQSDMHEMVDINWMLLRVMKSVAWCDFQINGLLTDRKGGIDVRDVVQNTLLTSFFYVEKLLDKNPGMIMYKNDIHITLLCAMITAIKFHYDHIDRVVHTCCIMFNIAQEDLERAEGSFCNAMDFEFFINHNEYDTYVKGFDNIYNSTTEQKME